MIKRIIALSLVTFSTHLFADDFFCPTTFSCDPLNTPVCKASDGSSQFNHVQPRGMLFRGDYHFDSAAVVYSSSSDTGCLYTYHQKDSITRQIFVSASDMKIYPKPKGDNDFWSINGDTGSCFGTSLNCPFTNQP